MSIASSRDTLANQIARHALTPKGEQLIAQVRFATDPARRIRGGGSVTVRYPSRLMGRVMHLESRSFELPVACALDDDPNTKEFYEQPCRVDLPVRKEGALRATKVAVYPDFLVIEDDPSSPSGLWIGFVSAKPARRMAELAEQEPERYQQDESGRWHDRVLEEHLRRTYGFDHRIDTDAEVSAILVRNITYLEDYGAGEEEIAADVRKALRAAVTERPGLTGTELIEASGASRDDLNRAVWDCLIWYARDRELIKDLDRVHFYPSAELGRTLLVQPPAQSIEVGTLDIAVGSTFRWGDRTYEIVCLRGDEVDCLVEGSARMVKRAELERLFLDGHLKPQTVASTPAAAAAGLSEKAQRRLIARSAAIQRSLANGKAVGSGARRWVREYRRAERMHGHGIWGIRPGFERCGRWGQDGFRADHRDRELAKVVLEEQYLTPEQRSLIFAYRVYERRYALELAPSIPSGAPMSRKTFTKILRRTWSAQDIARARKGYKAANQAKLRGPIAGGRVDTGLPTSGDRAWERVHIDHTLLDLWVVDSVTREQIGRVWITVAVDAFSGKALAYELSLESPSKRLPMALLRKLVRQYHRLPTTLITDNGSEFKSTYFQTFCATYGIRHEYRRPAYPRDGSPVEGFFGRLGKLIHTLIGNARPAKEPRELDKDLAPEKRAVWTLQALDSEFLLGAFRQLNAESHPIRGLSFDEVYVESVAAQGLRPERRIAYDAAFLALTALPRAEELSVTRDGIVVTVGTTKVAYWCEAFRDNAVQRTTVPVRDEPWDISRKYAKVSGQWHVCRSERFRTELENRTDAEIEGASKELKARLSREPELDEIVDFLLATQSVERRLADEQRAARRRQLVHEASRDAETVTEDDDESCESDEIETASEERSADPRSAW